MSSAISNARTPAPARRELAVPRELASRFDAAVLQGEALGARVGSQPAADRAMLNAAVQQVLTPPPAGAAQATELRTLRDIAERRTDEGLARARQLDSSGMTGVWEDAFERYQQHAPLADAAAGQRILAEALATATSLSRSTKQAYRRPRPYVTDPALVPGLRKPGGNTSFPSGHATRAFAGATALSGLWPARRDELEALAQEVGFSRVYGGVHYPSDVVAGAMIGAASGAFALASGAEAAASRAAAA